MIRTSPQRTPTFSQTGRNAGFTLIETLIVVGLIAMIMFVAIPNLGLALKVNLNNSCRELATTIRTTYDEAVLKGQVYRLAFDMDRREYWVEVGDGKFLMRTTEQEEEERRLNEKRNDEEKAKHKEAFSLAQSVTKKKISLPKGVQFSEILTSRSKEPTKGGLVYAYVFPHGFVEKLVLHLKDNFDRESTLIVSSVTGKSRLFERYVKETE